MEHSARSGTQRVHSITFAVGASTSADETRPSLVRRSICRSRQQIRTSAPVATSKRPREPDAGRFDLGSPGASPRRNRASQRSYPFPIAKKEAGIGAPSHVCALRIPPVFRVHSGLVSGRLYGTAVVWTPATVSAFRRSGQRPRCESPVKENGATAIAPEFLVSGLGAFIRFGSSQAPIQNPWFSGESGLARRARGWRGGVTLCARRGKGDSLATIPIETA